MAKVENHLLVVISLVAVATVLIKGRDFDANVMMSMSSVFVELVLQNLAQGDVAFQLGTLALVVVQTGQLSVIRLVTVNPVNSPVVTMNVIVNKTKKYVPVKVLQINSKYFQRNELMSSGSKSLVLPVNVTATTTIE